MVFLAGAVKCVHGARPQEPTNLPGGGCGHRCQGCGGAKGGQLWAGGLAFRKLDAAAAAGIICLMLWNECMVAGLGCGIAGCSCSGANLFLALRCWFLDQQRRLLYSGRVLLAVPFSRLLLVWHCLLTNGCHPAGLTNFCCWSDFWARCVITVSANTCFFSHQPPEPSCTQFKSQHRLNTGKRAVLRRVACRRASAHKSYSLAAETVAWQSVRCTHESRPGRAAQVSSPPCT